MEPDDDEIELDYGDLIEGLDQIQKKAEELSHRVKQVITESTNPEEEEEIRIKASNR